MLSKPIEQKGLLQPWWLLLVIVLPLTLLGCVFWQLFSILESILPEKTQHLWFSYAAVYGLMVAGFAMYGGWLVWRKRLLPPAFCIVIFVTLLPFLYLWYWDLRYLLPPSTPRWMLNEEELLMLPLALCMPAFLYGLTVAVVWLTPVEKRKHGWVNFPLALLIPAAWYLFFLGPARLIRGEVARHLFPMLLILSTVVFVFLVWRGLFILLTQKSDWSFRQRTLWTVFFTLICPQLGLLIYNGVLASGSSGGIRPFGDLSHPLFYILAFLSGLTISWQSPTSAGPRMLLFAARVLFYPFTLFFFVLFLPFLPFSVLAIVFFGAGILMLAPLAVMFFHTTKLIRDFLSLRATFPASMQIAVALVMFCVGPALVVGSMWRERVILHRAMDFVFQPKRPAQSRVRVSQPRLRRALTVLQSQVRRHRGFLSHRRIPFLTSMYHTIVLDNMTLSAQKISMLSRIFLGTPWPVQKPGKRPAHPRFRSRQPAAWTGIQTLSEPDLVHPGGPVVLKDIRVRTRFDKKTRVYRSRVELVLRNTRKWGNQEYQTLLFIPPGAWMNRYYLDIGRKRVEGLLVEKKTALWIYRQITSSRKDPGLITHERGPWWRLRVFPFSSEQTRVTGWELMHTEPIVIKVGTRHVALGTKHPVALMGATYSRDRRVLFVPQHVKQKLTPVQRKPYFHFVLDCSALARSAMATYPDRIKALLERYKGKVDTYRVTLANYQVQTFRGEQPWEQALSGQVARGGFFLQRAIQSLFLALYREKAQSSFPVIVVLSPDVKRAVFSADMDSLMFLLPETHSYYVLDAEGTLRKKSLAYPDTREPRLAASVSFPERVTFSQPLHVSISPEPTSQPQPRVKSRPVALFQDYQILAWPNARHPQVFLRQNGWGSTVLLPSVKDTRGVNVLTRDGMIRSAYGRSSPSYRVTSARTTSWGWRSGLALRGQWLDYMLRTKPKEIWLAIIKSSWRSHLLTPLTAFTVLENQAQWEMLKRKQRDVLAGKPYLDLSSDVRRMSEPPLWLLLFCLCLGFLIRRHRTTH